MQESGKKGQVQLSFGMIFSVFIIIATVVIAGYVIIQFLKTKENVQCKIFYQKLQDTIDEAWKGDSSSIDLKRNPTPSIPGNVRYICFGNISQPVLNKDDSSMFEDLSLYAKRENNIFFYPSESCGTGNTAFTLKHVKTFGFFCTPIEKNKIDLRVMKARSDSLVTLCNSGREDCA